MTQTLGQLKLSLIGIPSQTAGSTGKLWANPVNFRFCPPPGRKLEEQPALGDAERLDAVPEHLRDRRRAADHPDVPPHLRDRDVRLAADRCRGAWARVTLDQL